MEPTQPIAPSAPANAVEYYRDASVRARMLEYCGARDGREMTAIYVAGLHSDLGPQPLWSRAERHAASDIEALWGQGADIARSLWDRRHLIFLVELDYENIDQAAESYLRPADVFLKLEPAYRAMRHALGSAGIDTRVIATGRGYQFTGRIPLDHPVVERLASVAPGVPAWHATVGARLPAGVDAGMTAIEARAFVGLGMVIEHLAHQVLANARPTSPIPVVFNGTIVGNGFVGRECVSIDFSHVGDPLDTRHCRAAFSTYQWHRLRPDIFGEHVGRAVPSLVALPRDHRPLTSLLLGGRDLAAGVRLAGRADASLPDVATGVERLVDAYAASRLAAFHRGYYAELQDMPAIDDAREPLNSSPPCVTRAFAQPNDLLLKPEHIQHVVRVLLARRWTPGAIARLIRSSYEEDHGWGDRWSRMDPASRAEFDVRVFAGMIVTGLDTCIDLNCVSAKEKDICPRSGCPVDLRRDAEALKWVSR